MENQVKEDLSKALLLNRSKLENINVLKLNKDQMNSIKGTVFSAFCFDNALLSGRILEAESITYGAVVVVINGRSKYAEHAWIKMSDGNHFDPTYQNESEIKKTYPEIRYFKLFEIKISEYKDIAESLGNYFSKISGMDMVWFRRGKAYKEYFFK